MNNSSVRKDANNEGILSWNSFQTLAEKYAKIQRRGKLEKEVVDRWKAIFEKWWNELTSYADENKEEDMANGNAMTSDRFKDLVYDFWVSTNPESKGKYMFGPFDQSIDELEQKIKKQ
ncbi:unnamed protein product [Medioppia subpectinata]|uniref:Uncharacterized protein n=1 Tax=Medioppia subpectinata TaxID=1979941 RepID=A0A7R9KFA7_9ACAR|nr:unnamed protein product [Medioppia subpectinata]CAG2102305.1 unnamed protein product [Medioppia subpectinata]